MKQIVLQSTITQTQTGDRLLGEYYKTLSNLGLLISKTFEFQTPTVVPFREGFGHYFSEQWRYYSHMNSATRHLLLVPSKNVA